MTLTLKMSGFDALRRKLDALDAEIVDAVGDALAETALQVEQRVRAEIRSGKSGRVYEKYNPRRTHKASAAGEAPATDLGGLLGSIYTDINPLRATVGSPLAYAYYLEFGTQRISPRPVWMRIAAEEGEKLDDRVKENLSEAFR